MNPFTESTVARPLPADHFDRRWENSAVSIPMLHRQPSGMSTEHGRTREARTADARSSDVRTREETSGPDHSSLMQHAGTPGHCGTRARSLWAAFGLGFSLMLPAALGALSNPAIMTGAAAVTAILMPRHVQALDLNQASAQELQTLRGIGPKTAAMIVDERTRGGRFASLSDLSDRVRGIGPKKAAALQAAGLDVGPEPAASKAGTPAAAAASGSPARSARR